jgi:hypothetical protein
MTPAGAHERPIRIPSERARYSSVNSCGELLSRLASIQMAGFAQVSSLLIADGSFLRHARAYYLAGF